MKTKPSPADSSIQSTPASNREVGQTAVHLPAPEDAKCIRLPFWRTRRIQLQHLRPESISNPRSSSGLIAHQEIKSLSSQPQNHPFTSGDTTLPAVMLLDNTSLSAHGGKTTGLSILSDIINATDNPTVFTVPAVSLDATVIQTILINKVLPQDLTAYLHQIALLDPQATFMIRSSSSQEDQEGQSNAGCFLSIPHVDQSLDQIFEAIKKVAKSIGQNNSGILVQAMVGEKPTAPYSIPSSGVVFAPDSRSHALGTINITAAPGHGVGIVDGIIPTDETIGVYDEQTNEINARTIVSIKPIRLAPTYTLEELHEVSNSKNLMYKPALPPHIIQAYANNANALQSRHQHGVDMETVVQYNVPFIVQQRSQDRAHFEATQNYVSADFLSKNRDSQHPVDVISYSGHHTVKMPREARLISSSLHDAYFNLYQTLEKKAKESGAAPPKFEAVFVYPPANPNSHAALMFRQLGISIIAVKNSKTMQLVDSEQLLFLDHQRALLLTAVKQEDLELYSGMLRYPAPTLYSIMSERSPFTQADTLSLNNLIHIMNSTDFKSNESIQALDIQHLLSKIQEEIQKSTSTNTTNTTNTMNTLLATLLYTIQNSQNTSTEENLLSSELKKYAFQYDESSSLYSTPHEITLDTLSSFNFILHEVTLDIVRLSRSAQQNVSKMHQLLYLNWIDAAIHQVPDANKGLVGINSLANITREKNRNKDFNNWFQKTINIYKDSKKTTKKNENTIKKIRNTLLFKKQSTGIHFENSKDPQTISPQGKLALLIMHRLSYALNTPEIKTTWLDLLSYCARSKSVTEQDLTELLTRSHARYTSYSFEALVSDVNLQAKQEFTIMPLGSKNIDYYLNDDQAPNKYLQELHDDNQKNSQIITPWNTPTGFDKRLHSIKKTASLVEKVISALTPNAPHQAMSILKEIETHIELLDLALKSIVTSQHYPKQERIVHYKALLKQFHAGSAPLLKKAFYQRHNTTTYSARLKRFNSTFNQVLVMSRDLKPSTTFNVAHALITTTSHCFPGIQSLGDIHTLTHQNSRAALGLIASKLRITRCLSQEINSFIDTFEGKRELFNSMIRETRHERRVDQFALTSIIHSNTLTQWQYALPLRDHGLRINFSLNADNTELSIAIAMDGENENNRFTIAANRIKEFKEPWKATQFQQGRQAWPTLETSSGHIIAWKEDFSLATEDIINRTLKFIMCIIEDSYLLAHGNTHEFILHNHLTLVYTLVDNFNELVDKKNQEELTKFLFEKLYRQRDLSLTSLKELIIECKVMEKECSLYELDETIRRVLERDH